MKTHRKPCVAGSFYPDDAIDLKSEVKLHISHSQKESNQAIKFLIVPHAGYFYSGSTAGTAYAEISPENYERVILIGPSHRFSFNGLVQSGEDVWETPMGETMVEKVSPTLFPIEQSYHKPEHSLEVQLPFLQHQLPKATILPLLVSGPLSDAERLASQLKELNSDKTLWVISSDFNHTGPAFQHYPSDFGYNSGREMDDEGIQQISEGNITGFSHFLSKTKSTICGALPILIAMNMMHNENRHSFTCKQYTCSQEKTYDENSVGYAALFS